MNNYIIDPMVFYWINVFGILQTVCAIVGIVSTLAGIGCAIGYHYNKEEMLDYDESSTYHIQHKNYAKVCKRFAIICFVMGIPMVIASIFFPGKQTSIEMLVAKTITFENVNWTVEQVKEIIDYIVKAFQSIV